jgi:hypothetical protein
MEIVIKKFTATDHEALLPYGNNPFAPHTTFLHRAT